MERKELGRNQQELLDAVDRLALAYSVHAQPIPEGAWDHWFGATKGANLKEIKKIISDWSKTSTRMMVPADMFKAIQAMKSNKRAAERVIAKEEEARAPIDPRVLDALHAATSKLQAANGRPTDWARVLMIKEAYGFAVTPFMAQSWRNSLGKTQQYQFEDFNGAFPIEDMPDERRSLYHDSHLHFVREYVAAHGLVLVYDKALATKRYFARKEAA